MLEISYNQDVKLRFNILRINFLLQKNYFREFLNRRKRKQPKKLRFAVVMPQFAVTNSVIE